MARNAAEIVNRQVMRWERGRSAIGALLARPYVQRPVVTVSSACGSRGRELGALVADRLGFDLFDRELVEAIARSARVRERAVRGLDGRLRDGISEYITSLFEEELFSPSEYRRHLSRVVLAIGGRGGAVIIGRGSQFILSPEATLMIRTTARLEARIANVARFEGVSTERAGAEVRRRDAERAAFCRRHFGKDIADPLHYELVLETAGGPLDQRAEVIARAFQRRFDPRGKEE